MTKPTSEHRQRRWPALVGLLIVSAVMYVSIMYKIIHYGP